MEDLDASQYIFFGGTENGWSNNAYSYKWLTEVFDPSIKLANPRTWRILIVDGHSSILISNLSLKPTPLKSIS